MMNRMHSGVRRLILRYTVSYLSVALLAVCFLIPIYLIAFRNTKEVRLNDLTTQLSKGFYTLGSDFAEVQSSLFYNLRGNSDIQNLALSGNQDPSNPRFLLGISKYMKNLVLDNRLIKEIVITFSRNDYVITKGRVFDNRESFYRDFFSYDSMDCLQWRQRLFDGQEVYWTGETIHMYEEPSRKFLTVNSYYPGGAQPTVAFSVVLDNQYVLEQLRIPAMEGGGFLYVAHDSAGILFSQGFTGTPMESPGTEEVYIAEDGTPCTVISLRDEQNKLTLAAGIPNAVFRQGIILLLQRITIYVALCLGIAFLISLGYAYLSYSPLKTVLRQLDTLQSGKPDLAGENIFRYIRDALEDMARQARDIRRESDSMRQSHETAVFSMLLRGCAVQNSAISAVFGEEPALQGDYVLVLAEQEEAGDLPQQAGALLRQVLTSFLKERFHSVYVHQGKPLCAVIHAADNGGVSHIAGELGQAAGLLGSALGNKVRMGISGLHRDLPALSEACDEAAYCLYWLRAEGRELAVYDSLPQRACAIHFADLEALHHMLSVGDQEGVDTFFQQTAGPVYLINSRQTESLFQLINLIFQSVLSSLPEQTGVRLYPYNADASPANLMSLQWETAKSICILVNSRKKSHNSRMKEEIMVFIEANYQRPDLSLTMIADHFHISERYASQFIKEQTGINYTTHLENLRMRQAQYLLSKTNIPIADVAQQVGFENKNTFYKAFKRRFNVSPNIYRENASPSPYPTQAHPATL